ncbi:MAG: type II toxin-antitoxin system RelE/ParE family toxin [Bacteroidales bacterium]|nr:type II toxin-antitoxin system RelE/ParE family toxin [Bacteroidales bacterium]
MANFILSNKAVEDLSKIWNYTFDYWSERQADNYYYMLLENSKEIAMHPNIGKNYEEIMEQLFGFRAGRHIIFYRKVNVNKVEITRILHEQMAIKNRIIE